MMEQVVKPSLFSSAHFLCKWVLLLLWYVCGLTAAIFWGSNDRFNSQRPRYTEAIENATPRKNHMQAFGLIRRDPARSYRPLYSVYFDELWTQGGELGIFRTGIYKIAKVTGFQLKLFQYSSESKLHHGSATFKEMPLGTLYDRITALQQDSAPTSGTSTTESSLRDGFKVEVALPNLSAAAEIRINGFDYQVFDDSERVLCITSKKAIASCTQSDVILRGHVIITVDDDKLESNYVRWDIRKNLFKVDGIYVLNRSGQITSGKGICVDTQLNSAVTQQATSKPTEANKCLAKLQ